MRKDITGPHQALHTTATSLLAVGSGMAGQRRSWYTTAMNIQLDEKQLIAAAREILLLLEGGKEKEAFQKMTTINAKLTKRNSSCFSTDIIALWNQVEIAANNLSNPRYFEDVKEELNKVTFDYNQTHQ